MTPPCDPSPWRQGVVCGEGSTHHLRATREGTGEVREGHLCLACVRAIKVAVPWLTLTFTPLMLGEEVCSDA